MTRAYDNRPFVARREFLKISGSSAAATAFAAATGYAGLVAAPVQAATVPNSALKTLTASQARIAVTIARTLFPHDFLADAHYMNAVAAVDAKASADAATARLVQEALDGFDARFTLMPEGAREAKLRSLEGSDFFKLIYNETLMSLYNNADLWPLFGYEGSSVEHGGYIDRGFDDLDWLPEA
ncbi:MAG: gluconate 2-dehydrogenase subunit 3 family protein [Gammaproteobacteria bacterium]|nr:gluconate 2-dehydrogenase subunit 3 family protein [Gammaproteobacteria bacterium]